MLDGFQAGLSWATILRKRDAFRRAFAGFDPAVVAKFGPADVERLVADAGIVRSRAKIEATIGGARAYLAMQAAGEDFSTFVWAMAGGAPIQATGERLVKSPLSEAISAALKKRGFKFVGPVIVYCLDAGLRHRQRPCRRLLPAACDRDLEEAEAAALDAGRLPGQHGTKSGPGAPMVETRNIQTAPGMVFDVSVGGSDDAPLVLLLHGFGVSRYFWDAQVAALAAAGYFAVAPNQRGYAAGARPDPADLAQYDIELLIGDALAIVKAVGHEGRRFHLVGHDWGGSLVWMIADRFPERVASLTSLSRPHPLAFARALAMPDGEQAHRSRHHKAFLDPEAGPRLLADNAQWFRTRLAANGVPAAAIERHLSVLGNPAAVEAALAWYRARGVAHQPVKPTAVPTLYLWGDADDTVGRAAAEGTGAFITAPYQFEILPASGITPRTRCRRRSARCCSRISPATRRNRAIISPNRHFPGSLARPAGFFAGVPSL